MAKIEIDEMRCKGCGLCTIACPKKCIVLSNQVNNYGYTPAVALDVENVCVGCALCSEMCPDVAIIVYK